MRLEDFKAYKRIIETQNLEEYSANENAMKVRAWLEENHRLDESEEGGGFFASIWKWLKSNFSPTSKKIHKLADEYAEAREAEIRADFADSANKDDVMRRKSRTDVSKLVEDKMHLEAKKDPDYEELVDALIIEKDYEVQTKLLAEFKGQLDPKTVSDLEKENQANKKLGDKKYSDAINKLTKDEQTALKDIQKRIVPEVIDKSNALRAIFPDMKASAEAVKFSVAFLKAIANSKNPKPPTWLTDTELSMENIASILKQIEETIQRNFQSLSKIDGVQDEEAKNAIKDAIFAALPTGSYDEKAIVKAAENSLKKPEPETPAIKAIAKDLAKDDKIATPEIKDVAGKDEVKAAVKQEVKTAATELQSDEEKVTQKAIREKIVADAQKWFKDKWKTYFSDYVSEDKYDEAITKFLVEYGAIGTTDKFAALKASDLFKDFCKKEGYKA